MMVGDVVGDVVVAAAAASVGDDDESGTSCFGEGRGDFRIAAREEALRDSTSRWVFDEVGAIIDRTAE